MGLADKLLGSDQCHCSMAFCCCEFLPHHEFKLIGSRNCETQVKINSFLLNCLYHVFDRIMKLRVMLSH